LLKIQFPKRSFATKMLETRILDYPGKSPRLMHLVSGHLTSPGAKPVVGKPGASKDSRRTIPAHRKKGLVVNKLSVVYVPVFSQLRTAKARYTIGNETKEGLNQSKRDSRR